MDFYNHQQYHVSMGNVAPVDVYFERTKEVESRRQENKRRMLEMWCCQHLQMLRTAA